MIFCSLFEAMFLLTDFSPSFDYCAKMRFSFYFHLILTLCPSFLFLLCACVCVHAVVRSPARRRQRVRELRGHVHSAVEAGRYGPLSVQRLRPLSQDERAESPSHQAQAAAGTFLNRHFPPSADDVSVSLCVCFPLYPGRSRPISCRKLTRQVQVSVFRYYIRNEI